MHVTLAYSSGINAPTSDTMPEGCSRGCSIRSGPETERQSPCMAPGSLIIRLHSRLLSHARTANGSFCAPSACQGAADCTWQPVKPSSLQAPPGSRLPPFMDQHQAGVDSATEVDCHFESCGFSAVHPGTLSGITSAACRYRSTKKSAAVTVHLRAGAAQRGSVGYAVAWSS